MKLLRLNLKKKWFDMILYGDKDEEYREIKPYYISILFDWKQSGLTREEFVDELLENNDSYLWIYLKSFTDNIIFDNGYKPLTERPSFAIGFDYININYGVPKWGAVPDKKYFVFHLIK